MTENESNFLKLAAPAAIASQAATGVPASITIAQAILESGWGKSVPPDSNNYFGIKAAHFVPPDQYVEAVTHEYVGGQLVTETDRFARFDSVADGFKAHALLLSQASRYAPAMAVRDDAAKFAAETAALPGEQQPKPAAPAEVKA